MSNPILIYFKINMKVNLSLVFIFYEVINFFLISFFNSNDSQ